MIKLFLDGPEWAFTKGEGSSTLLKGATTIFEAYNKLCEHFDVVYIPDQVYGQSKEGGWVLFEPTPPLDTYELEVKTFFNKKVDSC